MRTVDDLGVTTDWSLPDMTVAMIPSIVLSKLVEVLSHQIRIICEEAKVVLACP